MRRKVLNIEMYVHIYFFNHHPFIETYRLEAVYSFQIFLYKLFFSCNVSLSCYHSIYLSPNFFPYICFHLTLSLFLLFHLTVLSLYLSFCVYFSIFNSSFLHFCASFECGRPDFVEYTGLVPVTQKPIKTNPRWTGAN